MIDPFCCNECDWLPLCHACGDYIDYCQGHGDHYYADFIEYQIMLGNLSPAARDMPKDQVIAQWEEYAGEDY